MRFKLWLAPSGSELVGLDRTGRMVTASKDGVDEAMDLTAFVDMDLPKPEPIE